MNFRDTGQDYYKVLGVASIATTEEIQRAYNKLARQYHPDTNPGESEEKKKENKKKFVEATEAFEILNDTDKRRQYDAMRSSGASESAGRSKRTSSAGSRRSTGNHNPQYESHTTNDWHSEESWFDWNSDKKTHQQTDEPDFSEASFEESTSRFKRDNDAAGWEILHALDPNYNLNSEYVSWTKTLPDPTHQQINMHLWFASPRIGTYKERTEHFRHNQLQSLRASLAALGAKNISSPEEFGGHGGTADLTFSIDATTDPRLVQLFDGYWDYRSPRAHEKGTEHHHFLKKAWMMSGIKTPELFKHDEFKDHLKWLLRQCAPWQLIGPKGSDVLKYIGMDVKHPQPIPQFEGAEPPIPPQAFTNFYIAALEMLGINIEGKRAASPFSYGNPDAGSSSRNEDFIIIKDPEAFRKMKEMGLISEELATQANYEKHAAQAKRSSNIERPRR